MDAVPSMLEYIVRGAASAVLPMNLLVMFIGLVVGIVGGMLPGITTVTAVALFVPFTFSMPPDMALIGLGGVFCGAMYGGANAAILINTPGTPGSIATSLDGYPLVMQGRAEEACYIALIASVLGGIFGTVVLMLFFEPLSVMALKFGSEAFFWMGLFGLSTLAAMFPGNIAKGLLGGAIGLALCTVGLDPVMGMPRFTFGCFDLVQGLDMVALMIGLFSLSQMFVMLESDEKYIVKMERQAHAFKLAVTDILRHLKLLSVASAIGTFIGALPGAGGSVAALVSYNEAKRWDKDPDRYGKGPLPVGRRKLCGWRWKTAAQRRSSRPALLPVDLGKAMTAPLPEPAGRAKALSPVWPVRRDSKSGARRRSPKEDSFYAQYIIFINYIIVFLHHSAPSWCNQGGM